MTLATRPQRIAIVAQNASTKFGGEAILPWHYFRLLLQRGVDVRLVVHERTKDELTALLPSAVDRMHFVPDLPVQVALWKMGRVLPSRIEENTVGVALHAVTGMMQRKVVRELIAKYGIELIHEPIPVSPKQPSFMFGLGVPVVIGPMNGGMDFPPAFAEHAGVAERIFMQAGRELSHAVNQLIPGKRDATLLLTANTRTRDALPRSARQHVLQLVENGVDLKMFGRSGPRKGRKAGPCRFAFVGRLVDWKRVDLLLAAHALLQDAKSELHVIGDGPLRPALEAQAQSLGLAQRVVFHGLVPQQRCSELLNACDALVLPSLRECGGAVVLEAMASGLPVIATNWGGPADYIKPEETGILVEPSSEKEFIDGLAVAMRRLASSPELCLKMGDAGHARVAREFDWERKIDRILEIYAEAMQRFRA